MMDNIMASKLYRPGSVAYVSRSGGMSNELNNIISQVTNGVYEGVAIGGDRYPCSTFCDHLLRFEDDPKVKMMVMLGEIGGVEEYKVCELLKNGKIKKPLVAWCIGTCASFLPSEVQFGHSGASAAAEKETACSKNRALKDAGAHVPNTFDDLATCIKKIYEELVQDGKIQLLDEKPPPAVPMDYSWARELGLIRKPSSFMSSICDERGNELLYAGVPISKIISEGLGLGGVLSLLWFRRRLPDYAFKFIEMCLIVTADHGPAVSGAHNTIVCARAGKDLVSSLVSGLLTIGERFGGALDMAAKQFSRAYDEGLNPMEFVHKMRKEGQLIMGIGHRVKSINNPDARVKILHDYVVEHFPEHPLVDYAKQVEQITTKKKPNLILNVDGIIGVAFVDLLRKSGRSIGFIGHYLDQKRLKQGLYRHPWDDITYLMPEDSTNL
ncbi:ATP-citrate synthase [Trichinella spiralis]|uniref:ATP citrate synthase n=1 Tax=Trichinella spiralis TaxID=6334 RepID=A0ABR3KAH7_TRISP